MVPVLVASLRRNAAALALAALVAVSRHTRDELHQLLGVPTARIAVVP